MLRWTLLSFVILIAAGCTGSRWAKEDNDYARKYPRHTNNVGKTIKQAVDARHVTDKSGGYVSFAGRDEPVSGGLEVGMFHYSSPWFEQQVGLQALLHEGGHQLTGGLNGKLRLQVPSRLAPFVGIGGFIGWSGMESAENDLIDNDGDGSIDELGEYDHELTLAIFPEAGVHFWLNHRTRLTASANYYMTSSERDDGFVLYSVGLSFFGREYERNPVLATAVESGKVSGLEELMQVPPAPVREATPSPYENLVIEPAGDGG